MALLVARAFPLVIVLIFAFCGLSLLTAATLTWDGNLSGNGQPDAGGSWNTSTIDRWSNGSTSQAWSNTTPDSAIFGTNTGGATGILDISLDEAITVHDLTFNSAGAATYRLTTANGSKLTLGGPDTPVINNAVDATIQTVIAGSAGFEKRGAGILTLSGDAANEYTGLTTITAGTLRLQKSSVVNAPVTAINGDIRINGGTLLLGGINQIADTASITLDSGALTMANQEETLKNLTLNGGNSNGNGSSNAGNFTITDTLTINSSLLLNSFANWTTNKLVLDGTVTDILNITGNHGTNITKMNIGAGGLTIISGTHRILLNTGSTSAAKGSQLTLGGDVTVLAGSTTIERTGSNFGVSQVDQGSATRSWQINSGATLVVGVAVVGSSSSGLIKNGSGTLNLSGPLSNTYGGMTTLNAGTLKISKTFNATAIAGDITVNGGVLDWDMSNQIADTSTLYLNGGALNLGSFTETIANLYQTNGTVNQNGGDNNATFTITGILDVSGGEMIDINSNGRWSATNARFANVGDAFRLIGNSATVITRFTAGNNGSGGLTLAGGQTIYLNLGSSGSNAKGSELVLDGSFTADGVNQIITAAGSAGSARVNLKGGQRNFNINSGTTTIAVPIFSTTLTDSGTGVINTIGGITKTGGGTLELNSGNSYTGNTIINQGTLKLGSGGSITASPRIIVASSAVYDVSSAFAYTLISNQTLEGGGSILGDVSIADGATLSAGTIGGDITQTLTFGASLTLASGSTTVFDLGVGNDHDHIIVEGDFVQQAGAKILIHSDGFIPTAGASFNLFTLNGSSLFVMPFGSLFRTGADDNGTILDLPDISSSGMFWDLTLFASAGTITISPEPSRALLVASGVATILFRRRRPAKRALALQSTS